MKHPFTRTACGFAAATIIAFALVACDESTCSPNLDANGTGTDNVDSAGIDNPPAPVDSLPQGISSGNDEPPMSSQIIEPPQSSSSFDIPLSSQAEPQNCLHISDTDGPTENGNCDSNIDTVRVIDCATGEKMRCTFNYWVRDVCAPGGDCNGDGIPDGDRRIDLEPCDTDTLLEFFGRHYQCVENQWVYLQAPAPDDNREKATNASVKHREGPAVAPRVVMVKNEDNTITIRDDGYNASNNFVIEDVYTELSGDTVIVDVIYPDGANISSFEIGALTFTVSNAYANAKHLKYKDGSRSVQEIFEEDELLPCANNGSCATCDPMLDCDPMVAW